MWTEAGSETRSFPVVAGASAAAAIAAAAAAAIAAAAAAVIEVAALRTAREWVPSGGIL